MSFSGKNWIPSLWNKADSYNGKEHVCVNTKSWTQFQRDVGVCQQHLLESIPVVGGYYEKSYFSPALFWNSPLREQNQFLFHNCLDQLKSDLLPLYPWEIFALSNFLCHLCAGRTCKTIILDGLLLQSALVPVTKGMQQKKICATICITYAH